VFSLVFKNLPTIASLKDNFERYEEGIASDFTACIEVLSTATAR
jgi:hypothetical protein